MKAQRPGSDRCHDVAGPAFHLSVCASHSLLAPNSHRESGNGCRRQGPARLWVARKNKVKAIPCKECPSQGLPILTQSPAPGGSVRVCAGGGCAHTRTHVYTQKEITRAAKTFETPKKLLGKNTFRENHRVAINIIRFVQIPIQ